MGNLRFLTAGESHGPALVATVEGLPAGLTISTPAFQKELERRRLGYGRSPRMNIETDELEILGGIRHGQTMGSPVSVVIRNAEWSKWVDAMDPEPRDDLDQVRETGRGQRLTRPRPGHADLVAALKYDYDDVRDALERASARETAARVVIGTLCKRLLEEVGASVVSHVVNIGGEHVPADSRRPGPGDLEDVDASSVRCLDPDAERRMVARIEQAYADKETVGGTIEVIVHGLPPGLGSHVHWDRKLDTRLAAACMSVQAMKGVEIGEGFLLASAPGSQAHDEILRDDSGYVRPTERSGGLEAGMSTGQPLRIRVAMKPLSSLPRPLSTVDMATHEPAQAITQRSDTCAVPRAGVVLEHVVAFVLADALLEKTGGDTLNEVRRNLASYLEAVGKR